MTGICCPRPKPRGCRPRRRSRGRCQKPGPVGRNPYLNFLRQFRKQNCGLSPVETIRAGAREWKRMKKEERLRFIKQAFYAPKRRRQSNMCAPVPKCRPSRPKCPPRRRPRRRSMC